MSLLLFIALILVKPMARADSFTTLFEMESLMETQFKIIRTLQHFVTKEKKRIDFLEAYTNRCKTEYSRAVEDVTYYLENPINAFTIIKRLSTDLDYVENVIKDKTGYKRNQSVKYPTKQDMHATLFGFARLHTTYNLNITDLAKGIISGSFNRNKNSFREIVVPLSASDCFYIGKVSFSNDYFKEAIEWWKEALNKYESEGCDLCPFAELEVMDKIIQTYNILGDDINTIVWTNKRIAMAPDDPGTTNRIQFVNALQRKMQKKGANNDIIKETTFVNNHKEHADFMDLCQGKVSVIIPFGLHCVYASGLNPVLRLMRVKIEQIHRQPDIIMIHDIISDEEIQTLFYLAKSQVWHNGSSTNENSAKRYLRNVKSADLDVSSDVIDRISTRLTAITGINMEHSEPLKIISYGIGGFYESHYDCHTERKPPNSFFEKYGDRIATFMIYLTNVQGGATIFPALKLTIFPKKGAALFWMNLLPSGDKDDYMVHSACPVLRGAKWIAIKWPHEVPQKVCPVWNTRKGVMNQQMYHEFTNEIHQTRTERQRQKKQKEVKGPLRNTRLRDEL